MLPKTVQEQFGIEDGPVERRSKGDQLSSSSMKDPPLVEGAVQNNQKSELVRIIDQSLQREIFVRIQKNLILIKVLADAAQKKFERAAVEKNGGDPAANTTIAVFHQALEQVKASQRRVSSVFAPLVFQLYPDQVETITLYMADVTMACAKNKEALPLQLLNAIELPKVQKELSEAKSLLPDLSSQESGNEVDRSKYFSSREYYLFLASIYLSETVEQLDTIFGNEVRRLTKLIRPEITAMENACSKIHKIHVKNHAKKSKWSWSSDFKTV